MRKAANDPAFSSLTIFAAIVALLILALSAWLAIAYRNQPILGFHSFRQTQTAITSYWACRGGFHLSYWTPIAGYPWSIPLEFPLYQWIVSAIACPLDLNLDAVGRLVSYSFLLACLIPSWMICRQLFGKLAKLYFFVFSALLMSAPLYLFWGRAFLMETVALCFSLFFITFSLNLVRGADRWRDALLCGLFLTLALLQKSTTVLPLMLFALAYLVRALPSIRRSHFTAPMLWKGVTAYIVPFLGGVIWVRYTDRVKMLNPFGQLLTSEKLMTWNFGTWHARLSADLWLGVIWQRVTVENVAGYLGIYVIFAGLLWTTGRRWVIAAASALFLLYFMVFENLLFIHAYYPISNTVYLIFSVTVAAVAMIEAHPARAKWIIAVPCAIVLLNLLTFFKGPLYKQETTVYSDNDPILASSYFVRDHTPSNSAILVYGDDWNSELPYYADRKAFVISKLFPAYTDPIIAPKFYIQEDPAATMICGDARADHQLLNMVSAAYRGWRKTTLELCDVYQPMNWAPRSAGVR